MTSRLHVERGRWVLTASRCFANCDQPAFADKSVDLGAAELISLTVDVDGMGDQEHVGGVVVELGPLMLPEDVFDGEFM